MKKGFFLVMLAQALSSLADNALFIAAIALIAELSGPDWMTPAMKWFFAFAYVILAAFVGAIADSFPKGRVMFVTNAIKISGCLLMFGFALLAPSDKSLHAYIVCFSYALVGIGAAAYSPAKYGIVTELLPPRDLVKGNSWIEGLTVLSIIFGVVLGGKLIEPPLSDFLLALPWMSVLAKTPAEAAIVVIGGIYILAAICNLLIPNTHFVYPKQESNPVKLLSVFASYVRILWQDKVGQISLAVTTLFWGAGATLQLIVLQWGRDHLQLSIAQSANLMGVAAIGTIVGSVLAGRVPLTRALHVLPIGVVMGFSVMLMTIVKETWAVYFTLILVGGLSGFFVVPLNALLQHRGHVLLSAGHSIAVQNFNEQLNILFMVAAYWFMLEMSLHINTIIIIFGVIVALLMTLVIAWCYRNQRRYPATFAEIGEEGHGRAQTGH
ncbi:lysophospholipid transporter LplT [Advenella kashmirensis WT001]|uniref:Lysophospholipid transporter LplT n=1 Tax=Advenella kashmirensis (strain DSM 17095 / LMG 22695 / WT001) TaxID=1036672 RepID=I3UB40_ADVKW|nr:lysophospholipid transporter LplT [Advenella kashmirensis]AFK62228.1 lysophospholipid transporter LplT [Advenella kashmirensis WT001]